MPVYFGTRGVFVGAMSSSTPLLFSDNFTLPSMSSYDDVTNTYVNMWPSGSVPRAWGSNVTDVTVTLRLNMSIPLVPNIAAASPLYYNLTLFGLVSGTWNSDGVVQSGLTALCASMSISNPIGLASGGSNFRFVLLTSGCVRHPSVVYNYSLVAWAYPSSEVGANQPSYGTGKQYTIVSYRSTASSPLPSWLNTNSSGYQFSLPSSMRSNNTDVVVTIRLQMTAVSPEKQNAAALRFSYANSDVNVTVLGSSTNGSNPYCDSVLLWSSITSSYIAAFDDYARNLVK